jgi:hypothetical protein
VMYTVHGSQAGVAGGVFAFITFHEH